MKTIILYYKLRVKLFISLVFLLITFFKGEAQTCNIVGDSQVCGSQIEFYSTPVSGLYNYEWTVYNGVLTGSGTNVSVAWGNSSTGTINLIVRNQLNQVVCSQSLNVNIYPSPIPSITASYSVGCGMPPRKDGQGGKRDEDKCLRACDSTWITYRTPFHSGSTYQWVINGSATVVSSSVDSIKVFWTGIGTGSVKVIETDSNGCVGETTVCIEIVGKPKALFTSLPSPVSGTIQACLNQTIQFINQSTQGNGSPIYSYEWIFGDGNTDVQLAPSNGNSSHAYSLPGNYTVYLVVQNECRCKDTFALNLQVSSLPGPDIFCIGTVCPDNTATYQTSSVCPSYQWSVTNGTILGSSTQQSVTVQWGTNSPGIITLATPGCSNTCSVPTSLFVPIIPPVSSIHGDSLVCYNSCETYAISCSIPIDSIVWSLPPGVSLQPGSSLINSHQITVCFDTLSFVGGTISATYFHKVPGSTSLLNCGGNASLYVSARPELNLFLSPPTICEYDMLNVFHSPNTVGGNIQWSIKDVGNNLVFTQTLLASQTLSVNSWINGPGVFTTEALGVNNQFCNSPATVQLEVNSAPPSPDSIKGPQIVCPNRPYTYLGYATSSSYSLVWEVQNGSPQNSAGNTVSVIWSNSGPYVLGLYQIDPKTGCKSTLIYDTIQSILPLVSSSILGLDTLCGNSQSNYGMNVPGDNFTWTISPSTAGSIISGQNTANVTVEWNNYIGNAVLSVNREVCGQQIVSSKIIHLVQAPAPTIISPSNTCVGANTNFNSPTLASNYFWNFGDGNTTTGQSPSHIYSSPGNYLVSLTVTYSGWCNDTATAYSFLMVNPNPNITISTPNPNIFCGTVGTVNMVVSAPVSGTVYTWYQSPSTILTTGNSYSSNTIGSYYVVGLNSYGCTATSNSIPIDTLCDSCAIQPGYSLDFSRINLSCNKDSFIGTYTSGASNPRWNFDDIFSSNNTATGTNTSHTFTEPGYYRVRFCVDVPNLSGTGTCELCTMKVDTIRYVPDFFDSLYCTSSGFNVKLKNNTKRIATLPVPSYFWSISPGSFSSTAVNSNFALSPGNYQVSLVVNGICSIIKNITVPGLPTASFTVADSICQGAPLSFTNNSTAYSSLIWTFGDGSSSLVNSPTKTYANASLYFIKLKVNNSYGCSDSTIKSVRVLPNTLNAFISPSDSSICEGDSILYTVTPSGGYPAYQFLWSTVQSGNQIWAKYTGNYSAQVSDSKGCFIKTSGVNVLTNPTPLPKISGSSHICYTDQEVYGVNYPTSAGYIVEWKVDGVVLSNQTNLFFFPPNIGTFLVTVTVQGPTGCSGFDTLLVTATNKPIVSVVSLSGALCENSNNILLGSHNVNSPIQSFWNNGSVGDTLTTSIPDVYVYTVVDSFGCSNSAQITVNKLPDFCGYQSGCYEICDSIKELVWYAPVGHPQYQWFYNGSPILGATNDTLHIPLYQSGDYHVQVTNNAGCTSESEITNIQFINCPNPCILEVKDSIWCDKLDPISGNQTYGVQFQLWNNLGTGSNVNIYSSSGIVTNITPAILSTGTNTVNFTYTHTNNSQTSGCFTIVIFNKEKKCDTTVCIKLPECEHKCTKELLMEQFECAGTDANGNSQYLVCTNVIWGGNSGSSLTVSSSTGSITPSSFVLSNGSQNICFTYTDLPPVNSLSTIYYSFFDPTTEQSCRDSLKWDTKPCKDSCKLELYGSCAHCEKLDNGIAMYGIDLTVFNPFGSNAIVSILPISAGVFGTINPNPIGPGMQQVMVSFTDNLPQDTIVCFKVILTSSLGEKCTKEICLYLPPCETLSKNKLTRNNLASVLYPNPANSEFNVSYNTKFGNTVEIEITDLAGKTVTRVPCDSGNGIHTFDTNGMQSGAYFVKVWVDSLLSVSHKLILIK